MGVLGEQTKQGVVQLSTRELDLLRVVAQELKVPLQHIAVTSSMLADGDIAPANMQHTHAELELMTRRMIQIVDSVLYAGHVETHQLALDMQPTNIASVAHRVVNELRAIADMYGVRLRLTMSRSLSPAAVDPVAVRHALYGLIDTFIRAAEVDYTITVNIKQQPDGITISVYSEGRGFSLAAIRESLATMHATPQPFKHQPNTTGMSFFVADTLSDAMAGSFKISSLRTGRRLSLVFPMSRQLELM